MIKFLPYFLDVAISPYEEMVYYFRENPAILIIICVIIALVVFGAVYAIVQKIRKNNKNICDSEVVNKSDEK